MLPPEFGRGRLATTPNALGCGGRYTCPRRPTSFDAAAARSGLLFRLSDRLRTYSRLTGACGLSTGSTTKAGPAGVYPYSVNPNHTGAGVPWQRLSPL